jgi:hypothetical protein
MRKLTENQTDVLKCLTNEFTKLSIICDKYGVIQGTKGYNNWGYVWKSKVSNLLKSLIVRNLVEYQYIGLYKLKLPE